MTGHGGVEKRVASAKGAGLDAKRRMFNGFIHATSMARGDAVPDPRPVGPMCRALRWMERSVERKKP